MDPVTLPIYLDQPTTGCLLPLIDFATSGELQGFGDAPSPASLPAGHAGFASSLLDARASVGLFGLAGLDASSQWTTRSYEWCRYDTRSSHGRGVGYEIQWGFGYRAHFQSTQQDFAPSVNFHELAFKTRLSGLQTSFAVETFGLLDTRLYSALPPIDGFDANTSAALNAAAAADVDEALSSGAAVPVPMGVVFAGDFAALAIRKAMSIRLAVAMLQAKKTKGDALAQAARQGLLAAEVERVYAAWLTNPDDAAHLADRWLKTSSAFLSPAAKQSEIESLLSPPVDVPGAGSIGGADAIAGATRTIVRMQLVDIGTSVALGYGSTVSGWATSDARRLVFEIYTRKGAVDQIVQNGVALLQTKVSGLVRVNCFQSGVKAELQASLSGVCADAVVNNRTATLDFSGMGYGAALDHVQLNGEETAATAADRLLVVRDALHLLSDKANRVEVTPPATFVLQGGTEQAPHGFPGARAISRALECLRDQRSLPAARANLLDCGLDPSAIDALYAIGTKASASDWLLKASIT